MKTSNGSIMIINLSVAVEIKNIIFSPISQVFVFSMKLITAFNKVLQDVLSVCMFVCLLSHNLNHA